MPVHSWKRNQESLRRLVLAPLLLVACEPGASEDRPASRLVVADVILTVANGSRAATRISLESEAREYLLGDVASHATTSFSLPSEVFASPSVLRLKAVRAGGQPPLRSDTFQVRRGEKVVWTFSGAGRGTLVRY